MFIAHLPAGYLLTRALLDRKNLLAKQYRFFFALGLFAAVLPDLDLFYFYLIDNRQHLHHSYWTHLPVFWATVGLICILSAWLLKDAKLKTASRVFFPSLFSHLVLDSVAGKMFWLYPFIDERYSIFHISARFDWWVLNYIFHWTFAIELMICLAALSVFLNDRYRHAKPRTGFVSRA